MLKFVEDSITKACHKLDHALSNTDYYKGPGDESTYHRAQTLLALVQMREILERREASKPYQAPPEPGPNEL